MRQTGKMMRSRGVWGRCNVQGHGQSSGCELLQEIREDICGRHHDKSEAQTEIEDQLREMEETK